jgi:putative acetyltransferase
MKIKPVSGFSIRPIEARDNADIARIIRNSLAEFGANRPGTVYYDDTTDHLYELFQTERSAYLVVEKNDVVQGGAGIFPTQGLPDDTCELVKMYLIPEARGFGLGTALMEECLQLARENGFARIYLETMPELRKAISNYQKFGFTALEKPLGNSGHHGCDVWMIRDV